MEFYSVVKNRHSIRSFEEKPVEKEKLDKIIAATTLAPSAGNLQSYKIFIIKNQDTISDLVIACKDQDFIAQAPVVLVFCADQKKAHRQYEERGFELFSVQDATIAAAYAQLAAAAEGLGSVWIGTFDPLEISRLVNAPPYTLPIAVIPIGYPKELPEIRERQPLSKIIKEIK